MEIVSSGGNNTFGGFGLSPFKGRDDDEDEEKRPEKLPKELSSPSQKSKRRKLLHPTLNRSTLTHQQQYQWALGAYQALKDAGIGGNWAAKENTLRTAYYDVEAENQKEGKKNSAAYRKFNGCLTEAQRHLNDAHRTITVEPSIGVGGRRADAKMTNDERKDYKSHTEQTSTEGRLGIEHSLLGYLRAEPGVYVLDFTNGVPTWAWPIAMQHAAKGNLGVTIKFNSTTVIKNGVYVAPTITNFAVPIATNNISAISFSNSPTIIGTPTTTTNTNINNVPLPQQQPAVLTITSTNPQPGVPTHTTARGSTSAPPVKKAKITDFFSKADNKDK